MLANLEQIGFRTPNYTIGFQKSLLLFFFLCYGGKTITSCIIYGSSARYLAVIVIDGPCMYSKSKLNSFHPFQFILSWDELVMSISLLYRFNGALSIELTNDHPNMRIIHRKVALILGQWVSEVINLLSCLYVSSNY